MDWHSAGKHTKVKWLTERNLTLSLDPCSTEAFLKDVWLIIVNYVIAVCNTLIQYNIVFLSSQQDAVFELVSMGFNVAVWHTKFASRLAGKEKWVNVFLIYSSQPSMKAGRSNRTSNITIWNREGDCGVFIVARHHSGYRYVRQAHNKLRRLKTGFLQ